MSKIKIVDLFAGPGGLGEGFARFSPDNSIHNRPFQIVCSAEKDPAAVRTLRLRTFFRLCEAGGEVPQSYYDYVRGEAPEPYDSATEALWTHACREASTIELGTETGDQQLRDSVKRNLDKSDEWILIGGPPCQAYSLVGRSRNRGNASYNPAKDKRNFLYEHYLEILARHQPSAFIMENVKGLLSSRVGKQLMFPRIIKDLANPGLTVGTRSRPKYTIHALTAPCQFSHVDDVSELNPKDFIIRAEKFGIPQARHRVILLGIRQDSGLTPPAALQPTDHFLESATVLKGLPPLRSGITRMPTTTADWQGKIRQALQESSKAGLARRLHNRMLCAFTEDPKLQAGLQQGGSFVKASHVRTGRSKLEKHLLGSIIDKRCGGFLNHQARNHMPMDLVRYLYAITIARNEGRSPMATEYPEALAPNHRNWQSGKFADRFKVQIPQRPATTVTSHISKDGHYFIHPDPVQCRSLTVREAARLQTFPDNYFFEGNRTEQYIQVGNAVPPLLANQIAKIVYGLRGGGAASGND